MKFFALLCMAGLAMSTPLNKSNGGLIVGGVQVQPGDCKFQISLQKSSHFCGGAVLDDTTIITAAHCVEKTPASSLRIRVGSLQNGAGGQLIQVSKNTWHPNYDSWSINNDVAILKLAEKIIPTPQAGPIPMVPSGYDVEGKTVTVSGWGYTKESGGTLPRDLLKVTVPVVPRDVCNKQYNGQITKQMFCAGVPEGGKGDSGGPIYVKEGDVEKLVGVVSWGRGCARPNYAGVYTNIADPGLMDWIGKNRS